MPISFSKRVEISPDFYDEENNSVFNLIYKSRGLLSDSKPIAIQFSPLEFKDAILANLIMMSVFDSKSILPFELSTPKDCNDILETWTKEKTEKIGNNILTYFDLVAIKLGTLFKKHIENISKAHKQQVSVDEKNFKRKGGDEQLLDVWASRKKAYMKASIEQKNKK